MFEKLDDIVRKREEILRELSTPGIQNDPGRMTALMKEQAELEPLTDTYGKYLKAVRDREDSLELMKQEQDPEMREMLKEEFSSSKQREEELAGKLRLLLLPKDPDEGKNVIVEIRAGTGGDEAALWAADLYRMYTRYADRRGWSYEMISSSENGIGGFKECIFQISGPDAWQRMRFESGTHRVQRVPVTESGGRIQTSAATVAIMPEADEVDVEIDPKDVKFDVFRASGNGGQCVNTTDSAVRLTHLPTGIVISCQDEKSQIKNKSKAMKVLRSMLYVMKKEEQQSERASLRRNQVGSGDRSEKIRTYNFGQGRVTDHRIHLTLYRIDSIMDGDLDELTDALIKEDSFILIGTSMGGAVTAAFTAMNPERVKKIFWLAPAGMNFKAPLYMKIANIPPLGEIMFKIAGGKILLNERIALERDGNGARFVDAREPENAEERIVVAGVGVGFAGAAVGGCGWRF